MMLLEHDGVQECLATVSADWLFMLDVAKVSRFGNILTSFELSAREQNISALSRSMEARGK